MWHLYVIVDKAASLGRDLAWIARKAIAGGADVLQLRDKSASAKALIEEARNLLEVTRPAGIPLIINDRADVALASGADGVHLGQDDLPVSVARKILGNGKIIGKSTHSLEQALAANGEALDYFAIGPIFATPTKPDYEEVGLDIIAQVGRFAKHPVVTIGGIDEQALPSLKFAGAKCIAVVRAVCSAPDPEESSRKLKEMIS